MISVICNTKWTYNTFSFCSGEVWPNVKETAGQPVRGGAAAPAAVSGVPGGFGWWSGTTWPWRDGWRHHTQPAVQQRWFQLHPQRPGRHRHAAWWFAVWPASHPRGGGRVLLSGDARGWRGVWECWKWKFVQSELSRAQRCRFGGSEAWVYSTWKQSSYALFPGISTRKLLSTRHRWAVTRDLHFMILSFIYFNHYSNITRIRYWHYFNNNFPPNVCFYNTMKIILCRHKLFFYYSKIK